MIPLMGSSGAALKAAIKVGKRKEAKDKTIVVILPDGADRYMSTHYSNNARRYLKKARR